MDLTNKRIITAALTGAGNLKEQNPNIPYTPNEFADTVEKCYNAGASVVHIHGRNPDFQIGKGLTPFSFKLEHYEAVLNAVKKRVPNILINISTGGGGSPEERIRSIPTFKPELGSLNSASMNFANKNRKKGQGEMFNPGGTFINTFETIMMFAEIMRDNEVKPEIEIYDMGGMYNILYIKDRPNLFVEPMYFQFVFGVLGGIPFNVRNLSHLIDTLPIGSKWSVCGVSRDQFKAALCAITEGGNVRVGLEDNIRNHKGKLASGSHEQVEWAANIIELAGYEVATPEEAREILKLKNS